MKIIKINLSGLYFIAIGDDDDADDDVVEVNGVKKQ